MPGLLRGMARTAVVAGTATAVSNNVSRRQANRWAEQEQAQPGYMAPVQTQQAIDSNQDAAIEQLEKLGQLKEQGILTEEEFAAKKAQILGL